MQDDADDPSPCSSLCMGVGQRLRSVDPPFVIEKTAPCVVPQLQLVTGAAKRCQLVSSVSPPLTTPHPRPHHLPLHHL